MKRDLKITKFGDFCFIEAKQAFEILKPEGFFGIWWINTFVRSNKWLLDVDFVQKSEDKYISVEWLCYQITDTIKEMKREDDGYFQYLTDLKELSTYVRSLSPLKVFGDSFLIHELRNRGYNVNK